MFGWLASELPNPDTFPTGWKIHTDGSFDPQRPETAGWGFAAYDISDL